MGFTLVALVDLQTAPDGVSPAVGTASLVLNAAMSQPGVGTIAPVPVNGRYDAAGRLTAPDGSVLSVEANTDTATQPSGTAYYLTRHIVGAPSVTTTVVIPADAPLVNGVPASCAQCASEWNCSGQPVFVRRYTLLIGGRRYSGRH